MGRQAIDALLDRVEWKCAACGAAMGTCDCWIKCGCGRSYLRGGECGNAIWHIALQFSQEAADKIVEDMAQSYRLFQREHMAARLKRAVIRQTQPILIETFEGVEAAKRDREKSETRS